VDTATITPLKIAKFEGYPVTVYVVLGERFIDEPCVSLKFELHDGAADSLHAPGVDGQTEFSDAFKKALERASAYAASLNESKLDESIGNAAKAGGATKELAW
jgi:hypothetical protein